MLGPRVSFFGKSSHCMEGEKKGTMQLVQGHFLGKKSPQVAIF
jgi:hypothetical protein